MSRKLFVCGCTTGIEKRCTLSTFLQGNIFVLECLVIIFFVLLQMECIQEWLEVSGRTTPSQGLCIVCSPGDHRIKQRFRQPQ
jgi:hypothetical protein